MATTPQQAAISTAEVLELLEAKARPEQLAGMARFGIAGEGRLGVSIPELRRLARDCGRRQALADALWQTGIPDARILAGMVGEPARLGSRQMDAWVKEFNSWDVCDQVCLNLFVASPLAWAKVKTWAGSEAEFVRRAAFALLACLAVHDKAAGNQRFVESLALIHAAATDERNFVKKAVNWALRQIGKRNRPLNRAAIRAARKIQRLDSRAARWIAADALRELTSEAVRKKLGAVTTPAAQ
jgi:3-methyladenine DNA glycosylase AlkD